MGQHDYYDLLEVSRTASPEAILAAYRRLMRGVHPDARSDSDASGTFAQLTEAYRVLSHPERRRLYDLSRESSAEPAATQEHALQGAAKSRGQVVGEWAIAAILVSLGGLIGGGWHVAWGRGTAPAASSSDAVATPTAPGERLPTGELRLGTTLLFPQSLERADLYIEAGIPAGDAERIALAVDADAQQVQRTYGRRFAARPQIYVFANRGTYNSGVEAILGEEKPTLATTHAAGVALSSRGLVAVNWANAGDTSSLTTFRHELVHVMVAQIAKPTAENPVPRWLNEGSAELEEFTLPDTEWQAIRLRTAAASMVAARNYFALSSLRNSDGWDGRIGSLASLAYVEAAAAVEVLREDIGVAGVTRILEVMGQGQSFDDAFMEVVGVEASAFEDSAPERFKSLTAQLPGIVTLMDGELLRVRVFGFMPRSEVTFDVLGTSSKARNTDQTNVVVDEIGIWDTALGPGWPADTYSITATGLAPGSTARDGESASVTVRAVRQPD